MEEKNQLSRFIERYLDGRMQPAEKSWFEKEMNGNRWLTEEVDLRRKVNTYGANKEAVDFRRTLMSAEKRHRSRSLWQKAVQSKTAQYAAAIIGIVIISSLLITNSLQVKPDSIISQYSVFSPAMTARNATALENDDYMRAIEYFNNQDFENALIWFDKVVTSGINAEFEFRTGIANMTTQRYNKAIQSFKKVVEHNNNMFIYDAKWYLGVCYYQTNDLARAKVIFEAIAASDSRYRKPARKMARKI